MVLRFVCVFFTTSLVAACSVVGSSLINEGFSGRCESDAGSYYLPKTHIQIEIIENTVAAGNGASQTASQAPGLENGTLWHEIAVKRFRLPDPQRGYCLDYLWRGTSDDKVYVKKYKAASLLGVVSSDVTDRSLEIAQALIQTIFVSASGNPNYKLTSDGRDFGDVDAAGLVSNRRVFKSDYDPFDPERTAGINQALSRYGYCVVLEDYTFDLSRASVNDYCDKPMATYGRAGQKKFEYAFGPGLKDGGAHHPAVEAPAATDRGLFYRPRIGYQLNIFSKRNLQANGGWKLVASHLVPMENIAPIMSIGLDRTIFAQRKTTLVFDEGMLKEACHYKGSELEAAAKIPLVISQSVVALPANFISIRIDTTTGMKSLIDAQNNAIKAQTAYLADLNDLQTNAVGGDGPTGKVGKAVPLLAYDKTAGKYADFNPDYKTKFAADSAVWSGLESCKHDNATINEGLQVQALDIEPTQISGAQ